jgi:hypothetical protein
MLADFDILLFELFDSSGMKPRVFEFRYKTPGCSKLTLLWGAAGGAGIRGGDMFLESKLPPPPISIICGAGIIDIGSENKFISIMLLFALYLSV